MTLKRTGILPAIFFIFLSLFAAPPSFGQSPEISLREFASGQIKKGVRSIGMGGNGATWGNYALVWKDSSAALLDGGATRYTNNNSFSFTAVGVTTPALWRGLAIYAIALSQYASDISINLKSAGLGSGSVPVHGDGNNQAVFIKAAMPVGNGFSFGLLLSYERSQFSAVSDSSSSNYVRYETRWLPSGGFGIVYQADKRILIGFRALFNQDKEKRTDKLAISEGLNLAQEYRLGVSVNLWNGALIDLGGNLRHRHSEITNTSSSNLEPNIGFEQNILHRHLAFRFGVDETSPTGGFSIKFQPVTFDFAFVNKIGYARIGNLFGTNSNSFIATLIFNYSKFSNNKH
ncbi:MAG TPA: hypothetical protein VNV85_03295 [Puia sp.]|jgi:hypothetical protein|nr:hypothetical protein [Puia sp.]